MFASTIRALPSNQVVSSSLLILCRLASVGGSYVWRFQLNWETHDNQAATPRFGVFFTAANFPRQVAMRRLEKVGDDGLESYLVDIGVAPQDAARLVKRVHKECSLSIANFNMPDEYVAAYSNNAA